MSNRISISFLCKLPANRHFFPLYIQDSTFGHTHTHTHTITSVTTETTLLQPSFRFSLLSYILQLSCNSKITLCEYKVLTILQNVSKTATVTRRNHTGNNFH